jgi:hypothetical protein
MERSKGLRDCSSFPVESKESKTRRKLAVFGCCNSASTVQLDIGALKFCSWPGRGTLTSPIEKSGAMSSRQDI